MLQPASLVSKDADLKTPPTFIAVADELAKLQVQQVKLRYACSMCRDAQLELRLPAMTVQSLAAGTWWVHRLLPVLYKADALLLDEDRHQQHTNRVGPH
jgi:hypothetical protein